MIAVFGQWPKLSAPEYTCSNVNKEGVDVDLMDSATRMYEQGGTNKYVQSRMYEQGYTDNNVQTRMYKQGYRGTN